MEKADGFEFKLKSQNLYECLSPNQKFHDCYVDVYSFAEGEAEPEQVTEEYNK